MPNSLTWFLSRALVYSTLPPVSVSVRSPNKLARSFSWQHGINQSASSEESASHRISGYMFRWIYLPEPPTCLDRHFQSTAGLSSCVTPLLKCLFSGTGILNPFPITYAFRPWLRDRLTLRGRTFPRKPWDFGGKDSHPTFRYSCPHNHFYTVHVRFPLRFNPYRTLLYHASIRR